MSSRSVSRRTMLTGTGAATLAAAASGLAWSALARDDGGQRAASPVASPGPAASGTPRADADPHRTADGDSGVGGLYLTVANGGTEPDALMGGMTAVCAAVEPHAMRMDGAVMAMVFLPEGLPIPAGTTVKLKPSGDHVMLVGLNQDLRPDTTFPISLRFRRAGTVDLISSVRWAMDGDDLGVSPADAAPVTTGDLTIDTVWSRPAPMIAGVAATAGAT